MPSMISPNSAQPAPSGSPSHHPTTSYTAGLPAPPRILIPPPSMSLDHSHTRHGTHPPLASSTGVLPGSLQDWKYESRREAQQILPHLFLGPLSAAKDTTFLSLAGITQLLAVRSSMTSRLGARPPLPGIHYASIDVSNTGNLIGQFARASQIIDEHFVSTLPAGTQLELPLDGRRAPLPAGGGHTLVYCESGNERSAAVCAAYLMQHMGATAIQAIQMVQGRRFCVCFDDAMKWMLTSYEPIWMARRAQGGGHGQGQGDPGAQGEQGGARGKGKRRWEEDEDDASGSGGKGMAPFLDDDGRDVEMS
ncbi:protein-tyrosine phosphatase-like protein [Geopyxis carbonaria]|nr:protein-tyrosine phosphatase-like protein [Geopyxis carbonaria]